MTTQSTSFQRPARDVLRHVEETLADWAQDACDVDRVSFELKQKTLTFYLWDISRENGEYGSRQTPQLQPRARYLVLPPAADASSRAMIADLFAAALEHPDFAIAPDIPNWWQALGTQHRPAIALSAPLRLERQPDPVPRVTANARIEAMGLSQILGCVLGPKSTPVPGAVIRLRHSDRRVVCDRRGRFRLDGVPTGYDAKLSIEARGCVFSQLIDKTKIGQEETVIQIQFDN